MAANSELLMALEQTLANIHPAIVAKLNPGLSVTEINKTAASAQLTFTEEVYDLFIWKNGIQHQGINSIAQLLLFPVGIPFTLAEAAHDYDLLSVTKQFFSPNYFPLFYGDNDDILLIDLDRDSDTYKKICLYSAALMGEGDPITMFDSFSSMLETALVCYDQKAFWINYDRLEVNNDAHYRIGSDLNPNSEYWQVL